MPIEFDVVPHIEALNFPGVAEIEPVVWLLMLETILDELQPGTTECVRSHATGLHCPLQKIDGQKGNPCASGFRLVEQVEGMFPGQGGSSDACQHGLACEQTLQSLSVAWAPPVTC